MCSTQPSAAKFGGPEGSGSVRACTHPSQEAPGAGFEVTVGSPHEVTPRGDYVGSRRIPASQAALLHR